MDVEQQQGTWTQLSLFEEGMGSVRPGASGEGGTGPAAIEEWQASTALTRRRALTGAWFRAQGLVSLSERYAELQP